MSYYQTLEVIEENESWCLQRGYSKAMHQSVLIKRLKNDPVSLEERSSLIHEFHITKALSLQNVLQPLQLESDNGQPFLVLKNVIGYTLKTLLKKESMDVTSFLGIAIQLATSVGELHQSHVIHKAIRPEHIFIGEQEKTVLLTGFGDATRLKEENFHHGSSPYELNRQLAYMSPEQTGRMNRSIDYRTDLYSLGVTFYEMVTGRLPFATRDLAELVHAHLAVTPPAPHQLNQNIPYPISAIIMKLMAKMPDSRYQSANGLKRDLEKCFQALDQGCVQSVFPLETHDKMDYFELPHTLYSRREQIESLYQAFEQTGKGTATLVLIPGASGIGKTALVKEVEKPLVKEKGYFISGKFDQWERQKPYAPILQAFKDLIRQLLTEETERIAGWKQSLLQALSTHAGIVTKVLPELEWLLGQYPSPEDLPALEAKNRFLMVFQKFVHVFAQKAHPLVLFLDDLQWADRASIDLIEYLLSQPVSQYLMIIGAYRDNELKVGHPFTLFLEKVPTIGVNTREIHLSPLGYDDIGRYIAEAFHSDVKDVDRVTTVVERMSQGNPFFVRQLVQELFEGNIVTYDNKAFMWRVNLEQLNQLPLTGNIVDLLIKRMAKLSSETREVLKLASCIGSQFDLGTLSTIYESSMAQTAETLWEALEAGLIFPIDSGYKWVYPNIKPQSVFPKYRFAHDRVQQAVYITMSLENQKQTHLKIGRLLLKHTEEVDGTGLFEIVNHLNISKEYLIEKTEKERLAELNMRAGERAKQSAAFESALKFYKAGLHLLAKDSWVTHYALTFKLMMGVGECEYLNSQFDEAEALFDKVLKHAHSKTDRLAVYNIKMTLYTHVHRVEEAVDAGIQGLQLFGWRVPRRPGKLGVAKELLLTKWALKRVASKDLLQLPRLKDEETKFLMQTIMNMNGPAFHVDRYLVSWLMFHTLRLTLKHGSTELTGLVFNNYALILTSGFLDFETSYTFADLAIQHVKQTENKGVAGRVFFLHGSFINHWKKHLATNLDYLRQSQSYCIESGNLHLAGANSSFIGMILFLLGNSLAAAETGIDQQLQFVKEIRYTLSNDFLNEMKQWIQILRHPNKDPEWEFPAITEDLSALVIHAIVRLQMAYLFDQPRHAHEQLVLLEKHFDQLSILIIDPEYYLYQSLWLVRFYAKANQREQRHYRKILQTNLKKLKKLAEHSPDNYQHKYVLVQAEVARIFNKEHDLAILYDRAISLAEAHGYFHESALASECAAQYYQDKNIMTLAEHYRVLAYQYYAQWGALGKAERLLRQYPTLQKQAKQSRVYSGAQEKKIERLDIGSITEASQALSREIILTHLLEKLLSIVLKNAGASRGLLLLYNGDQLTVVGKGGLRYEQENIEVRALHQEPLEALYSKMVVSYVVQSQEAVVIDDAAADGIFARDPYIIKHQPKSMLCLPIIHQGRLIGALYLENNEATHAFTRERIEVLTLVASQAAISIENATLYAHLEQKVAERTRDLEAANQELEKAYRNITHSEDFRRQLLSNISHDLRTPLTSIQGYIEAILDGVVQSADEEKGVLHRAKEKTKALNRLINDLFDLSKLEARQMTFAFDFVPIDSLLLYLYQQNQLEVEAAGLVFDFMLPDQTDFPLVKVDVDRIAQAVSNIIMNAINHTESGSIQLCLALESEKEQAMVTIQDTGSGIHEQDLPHIFNRYYTKPGRTSKKGNGLGLSISKEIISLHQGQLTAKSTLGVGTCFCIELPLFELKDTVIAEETLSTL
nr:ATP-binding sensor histidine kinase [Pullulanibacillus pueri]